jgi:hypothetical protein
MMPIHDWTRAEDGTFRDFHMTWMIEIKRSLNHSVLPTNYYAMVEQHALGLVPDVLTRELLSPRAPETNGAGETLLMTAPSRVQTIARADARPRQKKQRVVTVRRTPDHRLVAVIEVVSPGNKSPRHGLNSFVNKGQELLESGIHLMILDLHPPGPFDPHGIHAALWRRFARKAYESPAGKPLTFAAYDASEPVTAYVEPAAVGDPLPQLPLFLLPGRHVELPLEPSYAAAFAEVPWQVRGPLELAGGAG